MFVLVRQRSEGATSNRCGWSGSIKVVKDINKGATLEGLSAGSQQKSKGET
jgi:hypothetical protein